MQVRKHASRSSEALKSETCADLLNKMSYFAVGVGVGTPEQTFELVADTGSDSVIVTSCACVEQGFCSADDKCFRGTGISSTFAMSNSTLGPPLTLGMTFGSGTVVTVIASDNVSIGEVGAMMRDGLLLMVDRRELALRGQFEGILGLGPMRNPLIEDDSTWSEDGSQKASQMWRKMTTSGPDGEQYTPSLFVEKANVSRFSICFNDAGQNGALRLNLAPLIRPVKNIGVFHWGLGVFGVGADLDKPSFCDPSSMAPGQVTPCGAIPDSGTTLMMGPEQQITALFENLCTKWARCRDMMKVAKGKSGAQLFQELLHSCESWKHDGEMDLTEVPSVFIRVGEPGNLQTIEITPWAYVIETVELKYKEYFRQLLGLKAEAGNASVEEGQKVCVPAFGAMEYTTKLNGPVWILGTSLFYEYTVSFDIEANTMSIGQKQDCIQCNETYPSFLSRKGLGMGGHSSASQRRRRTVTAPPRVAYYNLSLPL